MSLPLFSFLFCLSPSRSPCLFPSFSFLKKRASPGIEPGPPAPKAGILPLNYKAFLSTLFSLSSSLDLSFTLSLTPFLPSLLLPSSPFSLLSSLPPFQKRGLWRESNPRHLHPKQVFYHLTTKPFYLLLRVSTSFLFSLLLLFSPLPSPLFSFSIKL